MQAVLAPLTVPAYRKLLVSSALWWLTLAMWTVVAGAVVLDLTNSALAVTLLTFWRRAAQLSVGAFAGPVGDRFGRRTTLLFTQGLTLLTCTAILLLFAGDRLAGWQITVAAFAIGAAWTLDMPARTALAPDLVGRALTTDAMILESFIQSLLASVGSVAAGWLLDTVGAAGVFGVMALLTGANVILLQRFSRQQVRRTVMVGGHSLWQAIGEGAGYVRQNQAILAVVLISTVMNIWIFPSMSLLPVFARDVLGRGGFGLGLLGAGYSLGNFVGLYAISQLRRRISIAHLFIAGTLLECGALIAFAFSPLFWLAWGFLFVAGLGQAGFHTLRNSLLLLSASDEMRGRAMSLVVLTQGAGLPGEYQTGMLADRMGAPWTVGLQASLTALAAAGIIWAIPALRGDKNAA